jgi:hypothetical protein
VTAGERARRETGRNGLWPSMRVTKVLPNYWETFNALSIVITADHHIARTGRFAHACCNLP